MKKIYDMTVAERHDFLEQQGLLSAAEINLLQRGLAAFSRDDDQHEPIENFIGFMPVPVGLIPRIVVNDRARVVPVALEEPTLIAGVANAAKLSEAEGGFKVESNDGHWQGGEVVMEKIPDAELTAMTIQTPAAREEIVRRAEQEKWPLTRRGFEFEWIDARVTRPQMVYNPAKWLVVRFGLSCGSTMGARVVSETAERLAQYLEEKFGGRRLLAIVTNTLCTQYIADARWRAADLPGGEDTAKRIQSAASYAARDPDRAATQMKGVMNAVDGVLLATGNDWRAGEAANHRLRTPFNEQSRLSYLYDSEKGCLSGTAILNITCGTVGSATGTPMAALARKIMGVESVLDLGSVAAAMGLAANFAALRTLVTTGITVPFQEAKQKYRP